MNALIEEAVQATIDAGLAVNGEYGVAAARHAARYALSALVSAPADPAPAPAADVVEARRADVLIAALEFYANPAVYAPHPHGPAFDRRDISFKAKNALAEFRGVE